MATESIPAFVGSHKVARWEPGVEGRLKQKRGSVLSSATVVSLVTGAFAYGIFSGGTTPAERVLGAGYIIGIAALVWGAVAALMARLDRATTVVFDWAGRRLRITALWFKETHAFAELQALEIQHERSVSGGPSYTSDYRCSLWAIAAAAGSEPDRILILSTEFFHDPDQPHRIALSLANGLSAALGIPVTESR